MADDSGKAPPEPSAIRNTLRDINKDLSLRGGLRSAVASSRQGGRVIGGSVSALATATRQSMQPPRQENFEHAIARLGLDPEMLPVIHNQLLIQMYLAFFVGVAGLTSFLNLLFLGRASSGVIALLIAMAGLFRAAQSSMQAFFIRRRQLGLVQEWLRSPSEWFPSRLPGGVDMAPNDPLRDPVIVTRLARRVHRNVVIGLSFAVLFGVLWSSFHSFNMMGWSMISVTLAVLFVLLAARDSFEVYKRRKGIVCDLHPWLTQPSTWIPGAVDRSATGMASKTRTRSRHD